MDLQHKILMKKLRMTITTRKSRSNLDILAQVSEEVQKQEGLTNFEILHEYMQCVPCGGILNPIIASFLQTFFT